MRRADCQVEQGLAAFTSSPPAREHLAGLRRGVLFLLAVAGVIFLFASVGLHSAEPAGAASSPSASLAPSSCSMGGRYCVALAGGETDLYQ